MYHLHFHEGNQSFKVIRTGITITPENDGFLILSHASLAYLVGVAAGLKALMKLKSEPFKAFYLRDLLLAYIEPSVKQGD